MSKSLVSVIGSLKEYKGDHKNIAIATNLSERQSNKLETIKK